jgi:hypothetical protein
MPNPAMDLKSASCRTPVGVASPGQRRVLKLDRTAATKGTATKGTALLLPSDLPFRAWKHIGEQILVFSDSTAWWIGDWLIFGRDKYPDRYQRAVEETSLDYQTLRNYAWVAGRFAVSRRRDMLSFQHHVEVAKLPEDQQDLWLERAERSGWSRNELRRQLRSIRPHRAAKKEPPSHVVELSISCERQELWQIAAHLARVDLPEWISATLDGAAQG